MRGGRHEYPGASPNVPPGWTRLSREISLGSLHGPTAREEGIEREKIIWARWRQESDGRLTVVVTYEAEEGYETRELSFDSLDSATEELGHSFRDVVSKVIAEGYSAGRWRP